MDLKSFLGRDVGEYLTVADKPLEISLRKIQRRNSLHFWKWRESMRVQRREERFDCRQSRVYEVCVTMSELERLKTNRSRFEGVALDTGAQKSVIGVQQAREYVKMTRPLQEGSDLARGVGLKLLPSRRILKFVDSRCRSLGSMRIDIPCPNEVMEVYVDVVALDVPFLIGLDLMDKHRLQFLSVSNELERTAVDGSSCWRMLVTRKMGHGYIEWAVENVLYSRSQLVRLHKHLYHPSTGKLLSLLRRATPDLVNVETKSTLEEISKACLACQTYSGSPMHFSIRTPEHVVFNQELRTDLMFLEDRKPVLHVVDAGTTFQAATFLDGEDANSVWNAFLIC
jgi:hypothetical protein